MKTVKRLPSGSARDSLFPGYERITFNGTPGDDIFTGGSDNDVAHGLGGNDQLSGAGGGDMLAGGDGADVLDGGDGDDTLFSGIYNNFSTGQSLPLPILDTGTEVDTLNGGIGSDRIFAGYGDNVDGGDHGDFWGDALLISFLGASSGVVADFRLAMLTIGGGTITGIENCEWVEGSNFDDNITLNDNASRGAPTLYGHGGNDRLVAGYYTRAVYGGDGNDVLEGGNAQYGPLLDGGAGDDTLSSNWGSTIRFQGGAGNDIINSGGGGVQGGDGNDVITLRTTYYPEQHYADAGDDVMNGCTDRDIFFGGAGADTIYGNEGDDYLYSADGDYYQLAQQQDIGAEQDQLFGGIGNDRIVIGYGDSADGGTGTDTLVLSLRGAASGVTLNSGALLAGTTIGGGTVQGFEVLEHLTGSAFADTLTLATHGQLLLVDAGDGDDLISSANSSVSVMGGNGNDRFVSGAAGDTLDGGAGTDTVDYRNYAASVTVTLALTAGQTGTGAGGDSLVNVENVDGSAFGDTLNGSNDANLLQGLAGDDTLRGYGGNDTLIGGAGTDTMLGGTGNDIYFIDSLSDVVTELAGEGADILYTGFGYTLAAGVSIELLTTTDLASTAAIDMTGNNLDNTIWGNHGNNTLSGGIGGNDTLVGFLGNDIYLVNNITENIVENAGEGTDIVYVNSSYTLSAHASIELLTTYDIAGTQAYDLTGNNLDNTIWGNRGNNTLSGGVGGQDTLVGFLGDDIYLINNITEVVVEHTGEGTDIVYVNSSYTLSAHASIELLSTYDIAGTQNFDMTGNELSNTIWGNRGNNTISGGIGGNDTLVGFLGNDIYLINNGNEHISELANEGTDIVYAGVSYVLSAGASVELLSTTGIGDMNAINLTGNELANTIWGNNGANILNGGLGADTLSGFGGADTFAFTTALGASNVDAIIDLVAGTDKVALDDAIFAGIGTPGAFNANAFRAGDAAADADDRIVYNAAAGQLFYDADGNGAGAAVLFATLQGNPPLTAGDFAVI